MSLPQEQIEFKPSRKLCLNLRSLRLLKPNLSLVISFTPIVESPIRNWSYELSRLFHSLTVNGKKEFLEKVCLTLNRVMLSISFLFLYSVLVVGILSNRYYF